MKVCFTIPYLTSQCSRTKIFEKLLQSIISSINCTVKKINIDIIVYFNGQKNSQLNNEIDRIIRNLPNNKKTRFEILYSEAPNKTLCINNVLKRKDQYHGIIFCDNDIIIPINFFDSVFRIYYETKKNQQIACFSKHAANFNLNAFTKKTGFVFHPSVKRILIKENLFPEFRPTGSIYLIKHTCDITFPISCNEAEIFKSRNDSFDTGIYVISFLPDTYQEELTRRVRQLSANMNSSMETRFKNENLLIFEGGYLNKVSQKIQESLLLHHSILKEAIKLI